VISKRNYKYLVYSASLSSWVLIAAADNPFPTIGNLGWVGDGWCWGHQRECECEWGWGQQRRWGHHKISPE